MDILVILTIGASAIVIASLVLIIRQKRHRGFVDKSINELKTFVSQSNGLLHNEAVLIHNFSPLIEQAQYRAEYLHELCMTAMNNANINRDNDPVPGTIIYTRIGKSFNEEDNMKVFYESEFTDRSHDRWTSISETRKWVIGFHSGFKALDSLAVYHYLRQKIDVNHGSIRFKIDKDENTTWITLVLSIYIHEMPKEETIKMT